MSDRLEFKEFGIKHLPLVLSWYDWQEFYYYTTYPHYVPLEEIEGFLSHRGNTFIIEEDDNPVGICDFHLLEPKTKNCKIEIAFSSIGCYTPNGSKIVSSFIDRIFNNFDVD